MLPFRCAQLYFIRLLRDELTGQRTIIGVGAVNIMSQLETRDKGYISG